MANKAVAQARKRKHYTRDRYRTATKALIALMLLNLVLVAAVAGLTMTRDETIDYYAITCDSDPIRLSPLSSALVSARQLLDWTNEAASAAFNFNFVNWRAKMGELRPYFSVQGWGAFYNAFKKSQLDPVIAKKLMVTAVATDVPVIEHRGILNGRYTWRIAIPILVTYQSPSDTTQKRMIARIVVSRVPTVQTARGIAIVQFNVSAIQ